MIFLTFVYFVFVFNYLTTWQIDKLLNNSQGQSILSLSAQTSCNSVQQLCCHNNTVAGGFPLVGLEDTKCLSDQLCVLILIWSGCEAWRCDAEEEHVGGYGRLREAGSKTTGQQ